MSRRFYQSLALPVLSGLMCSVSVCSLASAQEAPNAPNAAAPPAADTSDTNKGTFSNVTDINKSVVPKTTTKASDLDAISGNSTFDALRDVPGVTNADSKGPGADNIQIRGIHLNSSTSYHVNDGLPLTNNLQNPSEDKARVEALKGVGALQFGFAAPGGLVNYVMKRATDAPITDVGIQMNSFGAAVETFDFGRRFGDQNQLGVRINGAAGTIVPGISQGAGSADGTRWMGSVGLDYQADPTLKFYFDYEKYQFDITEQGILQLPAASKTPGPGFNRIVLPSIPDPRLLRSGPWSQTNAEGTFYVGGFEKYLGDGWKFMAEAGESKSERPDRNLSTFTMALAGAAVPGGVSSAVTKTVVTNNITHAIISTTSTTKNTAASVGYAPYVATNFGTVVTKGKSVATVGATTTSTKTTTTTAQAWGQQNFLNGDGSLGIVSALHAEAVNEYVKTELTKKSKWGGINGELVENEMTFGYNYNYRDTNQNSSTSQTVAQNLYNPYATNVTINNGQTSFGPQQNYDQGYYLNNVLTYDKWLHFLAGVRMVEYDTSDTSNGGLYTLTNGVPVLGAAKGGGVPFVTTKTHSEYYTPAFGGIVDVNRHLSLYASYVKALEDEGLGAANTTNQNEALGAGLSVQEEVGFQIKAWNGLSFNLAHFYIKRPNVYTDTSTAGTINGISYTGTSVVNGLQIYSGEEFVMNYKLSPEWRFLLTGALTDAYQVAQVTGDVTSDVNGHSVENTPKFAGSATIFYSPEYMRGLTVNFGGDYKSPRAVNPVNQAYIPETYIYRTGFNYTTRIADKVTDFNFNVTNLFDERYWSTANNTALGVGLERQMRFGMKVHF